MLEKSQFSKLSHYMVTVALIGLQDVCNGMCCLCMYIKICKIRNTTAYNQPPSIIGVNNAHHQSIFKCNINCKEHLDCYPRHGDKQETMTSYSKDQGIDLVLQCVNDSLHYTVATATCYLCLCFFMLFGCLVASWFPPKWYKSKQVAYWQTNNKAPLLNHPQPILHQYHVQQT